MLSADRRLLQQWQRRVIYPCNAANRDIHDFFVKVVSAGYTFLPTAGAVSYLCLVLIQTYLHVTRLSHAGCSFCNLIGLPEIKTADSARNRSIVTRPFSWVGSGHETSVKYTVPYQRRVEAITCSRQTLYFCP